MHVFEFYKMLLDCLSCGLLVTLILFWFCCHREQSREQESPYRALLERLESTYPKDASIENWKNVLHEEKILR